MFWLFVVALWAAMLLSPILLLFLFLPQGKRCPRCGDDTFLLHSRVLHPFRRYLHLRWCTGCGWEGVTRRTRSPRRTRKLESVPEDRDDAPWKSPGT